MANTIKLFQGWLNTNADLDQSWTLERLWDTFNHEGGEGGPLDFKTVGVPRLVGILQNNGFPAVQQVTVLGWTSLGDALNNL